MADGTSDHRQGWPRRFQCPVYKVGDAGSPLESDFEKTKIFYALSLLVSGTCGACGSGRLGGEHNSLADIGAVFSRSNLDWAMQRLSWVCPLSPMSAKCSSAVCVLHLDRRHKAMS